MVNFKINVHLDTCCSQLQKRMHIYSSTLLILLDLSIQSTQIFFYYNSQGSESAIHTFSTTETIPCCFKCRQMLHSLT